MSDLAELEVDAELRHLIDDYEYWASQLYMIRDKRNELIPLTLNNVQRKIGEIEKEEIEKNGNA